MSLSPQVRFRDLKTAKIIKNHVGLKRLIETQGFPPGKWLGPNTHVWDESEVAEWLASRPAARPPSEVSNAPPTRPRRPVAKSTKRLAKRSRK
jgi:hypothetical protein